MVTCEHCQGQGQRARVVDSLIVQDALASLDTLAAKHGPLLAGGIEREICFRGLEMRLSDLESHLGGADATALARTLTLSGWEIGASNEVEWRIDWDLESLVRNRVKVAMDAERKARRAAEMGYTAV